MKIINFSLLIIILCNTINYSMDNEENIKKQINILEKIYNFTIVFNEKNKPFSDMTKKKVSSEFFELIYFQSETNRNNLKIENYKNELVTETKDLQETKVIQTESPRSIYLMVCKEKGLLKSIETLVIRLKALSLKRNLKQLTEKESLIESICSEDVCQYFSSINKINWIKQNQSTTEFQKHCIKLESDLFKYLIKNKNKEHVKAFFEHFPLLKKELTTCYCCWKKLL